MATTTPTSTKVKGTVIAARLSFVRNRGGEALLDRVLARLPAEDAKALRGVILVTSSYSMPLNLRLDEAIAVELSPGEPDRIFVEMGRSSADVNLSGPQRGFIRQADPQHLLSFTEAIYGYYYSVGKRTCVRTGDQSATLTTEGAEEVTPGDCLTVVGWYQRALELSGGADVRVVHTLCRSRGDAVCEYQVSWS